MSVRALAVAVTALLAPAAAVQPPIYVAESSGSWHGVVSTSGVRVGGARGASAYAPVAFAPDRAAWVVALDDRRSLSVHRVGARSRKIPVPLMTSAPVFGARGRIVVASGQTIRVVGGRTIRPTLLYDARIVELDVSRDGSRFVAGVESGDGRKGTLAFTLYAVMRTTTRVLVGGFDAYSDRAHARLSPDGKNVAFVKGGDVWVMPFAGGTPRQLTHTSSPESDVEWSPDGTRLAYTSGRHGVNEVYVSTIAGVERRLTHTRPHPGGVPQRGSMMGAWSPDGRRIAVVTYNTVGVVPAAGGAERIVTRVTPEKSASFLGIGWPSPS